VTKDQIAQLLELACRSTKYRDVEREDAILQVIEWSGLSDSELLDIIGAAGLIRTPLSHDTVFIKTDYGYPRIQAFRLDKLIHRKFTEDGYPAPDHAVFNVEQETGGDQWYQLSVISETHYKLILEHICEQIDST